MIYNHVLKLFKKLQCHYTITDEDLGSPESLLRMLYVGCFPEMDGEDPGKYLVYST